MPEKFWAPYWGLTQEKLFVDHLGSFSVPGASVGRPQLLKRYREALERRTNWGGIPPSEVARLKAYVDAAITAREWADEMGRV